MIEIRERFEVPAAPDARLGRPLRPPRRRRLRARARSIDRSEEDGTLDASVQVKFGPTRVTFRVKANLELDEAARHGHHHGPGPGHHRRHADALDGARSA